MAWPEAYTFRLKNSLLYLGFVVEGRVVDWGST
jgi:hypothetical protein